MTLPTWTPRLGGSAPTLGDLSEEAVLRSFASSLRVAVADVGPGDDAAVLPSSHGRVVVTTDSMVHSLDWRDDWSAPGDVGRKIIAQNIADVVAMGARPVGVVVALAVERTTRVDWVVELTVGMSEELERAGTGVLGGDLSGVPAGVVITVTALGELAPGQEPLLRSNAEVGDVVVVSDRLGRSHAGLLLLQSPQVAERARAGSLSNAEQECVDFHRAPWPRYCAGSQARDAGMCCALDVSDGLVRDAARIARASGVGIDLDAQALTHMAQPLRALVGEKAFECVISGGEEHALLGTCRLERVPDGWSVIGHVVGADRPAGGTHGSHAELEANRVTISGVTPPQEGWDHFGG